MKIYAKRLFGILLAMLMSLTLLPGGAFSGRTATPLSSYSAGDIITFGSYPQTEVTDPDLITNLNAQTLGDDNTVTYDGIRYKRVCFTEYIHCYGGTTTDPVFSFQDDNGYYINTAYWFKYEPIQWRVLSNNNDELFVMAEKILASKPYHQVAVNVTWETCNMRSWLNNNFYNEAFDATEQAKIITSTVVNEVNPWYGTSGGNNTDDKLFLLSYSEVMNPDFGFSDDAARRTQGTDFAKSNGLSVNNSSIYSGNSSWWQRTPGYCQYHACHVNYDGDVDYHQKYYNSVSETSIGVRPILKINMKFVILTSKDGSTCVIDYTNELIYGLSPGIQSMEDYAQAALGYAMQYVPSANGFGTGTQVRVVSGDVLAERYTLIIFGDVNGDGNIDTSDAGNIVDYENFLISWDTAADSAYLAAADLNSDGNVDSADAGLVIDVENFLLTVDQTTGLAVPV